MISRRPADRSVGRLADRGYVGAIGGFSPTVENGGTGDQYIGACGGDQWGGLGRYPAVDLNVYRALANQRLDALQLFHDRGNEGLAAKARIDRHQENKIEPVEDIFD